MFWAVTVVLNLMVMSPVFASTMPPVMTAIAQCESGNKQFYKSGKLIRDYATGTHIGVYQIWVGHAKAAKKLGYDIYTRAGNVAMALYMYKTQGTAPWLASASCWKYA